MNIPKLLLSVGVTALLGVASAQPPPPAPGLADAAPLLVQWVRTPGDPAPTRIVRVPANRTLARVNGEAMTVSDLLPVGPSPIQSSYILSPARYAFLLDRAIKRRLVGQRAQADGVAISVDQQRQLVVVRERILASEGEPTEATHLNRVGTLADEIAFEQSDATSQLLLNSLLERAGISGPHLTAARVEQHYEHHRGQYPPLPAAAEERARVWQQIDFTIRQQLASKVHGEYVEARSQWLASLRSTATITQVDTVEADAPLSVRLAPSGRTVISWPDSDTPFILQETGSLAPTAAWTDVTSRVTTANGLNTVTVPLGAGARFYRLRLP